MRTGRMEDRNFWDIPGQQSGRESELGDSKLLISLMVSIWSYSTQLIRRDYIIFVNGECTGGAILWQVW